MTGGADGRRSGRATNAKGLITLCGLGRNYHDIWWRRHVRRQSPWTDWNREREAVFIHVPKNAGTSMYGTFGMEVPQHTHCPVTGYLASDRHAYSRYFSFAFVREPLERMVSAFHYLKEQPLSADDESWAKRHLGRFDDFESFAATLENPRRAAEALSWRHFMPQWYFLTDVRGRERVSFLGRVESLAEDVAAIGVELGIATRPKHDNATRSGATRTHATALDPRVRATVARLYAEDYRRYGYSPG